MTKLFALVATAAALIASVQAAGCPANRRLCGHTLIDDYQCKPLLPFELRAPIQTKTVAKPEIKRHRVGTARLHHPDR